MIISSLKDDAGVGGFRVGGVHRLTAALPVAIAVPLIVMSGISLDRVRATATANLGFESDLLYAAPLKLEAGANDDAAFRIRSVRHNLEQASGVASVTVADGLPLDFGGRSTRVSLQEDANVAPRVVSVHVTRVDDGYLSTMGIPLLRGRGFTADDRAGAEMVTVISKPLADQLFPNTENMGIPLSNVEPVAYVAGAAIAILVAVLASLAPARRAASVQPMVAMRSL